VIEETARIVELDGQLAWVETTRQTSCGSCSVNKGCGTATLAKVLGNRRTRVRALNPKGLGVGEQVVIGIQEDAFLRGSLAIYLVPLAGLMFGGGFGEFMAGRLMLARPDLLVLICAIGGLLAGLGWVKMFSRRVRDDSRYQPVILRRVMSGVMAPIEGPSS
jgi:sigma-E factor negative regulatory protein RseC